MREIKHRVHSERHMNDEREFVPRDQVRVLFII